MGIALQWTYANTNCRMNKNSPPTGHASAFAVNAGGEYGWFGSGGSGQQILDTLLLECVPAVSGEVHPLLNSKKFQR